MNKEFIYVDNNIIITDEEGNICDPIKYEDNILDRLYSQNIIEELNNELEDLKKENELIIEEINGDKKKSIREVFLTLTIPILVTFTMGGLYFLEPNSINNIKDGIIMLSIILSGNVSLVIGLNGIINYVNKKRELKNISEIIDSNQNKLSLEKEKLSALERVNTVSNNIYEDYDIVNIDTKEVRKKKVLERRK